MRILVIDDDHMVRKTVLKMVEKAGYQALSAENGRDGLQLLARSHCDVVLTDIIMPEIEGIELVMSVGKHYPTTRVIAMSGGFKFGNIDFLDMAAKLGASATLQKPFTQQTLVMAIEQSLGASSAA